MSKQDFMVLTRQGDFAFRTVGDKHCGMASAGDTQHCRYIVRVKCTPLLDADGYLFEQLKVQEFFDKIKSVRSTCELLVKRIAGELLDMIVRENGRIEVKWVEVTLSAEPYAALMRFRYHP